MGLQYLHDYEESYLYATFGIAPALRADLGVRLSASRVASAGLAATAIPAGG